MMYRFCGAFTEVGELKLNVFGQEAEFTDELAKDIILGGGYILPADHPVWKTFTEQEMSIYSDPRSHGQAKPAFLAKKKTAILACIDLRAEYEAAASHKPAPVEPAAHVEPSEPAAN